MENFLQQKLIQRCINKGMNQAEIFQQLQEQRDAFVKIQKHAEDAFSRGVWKRSVMTVSAYGCSLKSSSEYVADSLKEIKSELLQDLSKKELNHYFNAVYDGIEVAIPAASQYLDYITKVIRFALKYTNSVKYINPLNNMPIHLKINKKDRLELEYKVNGKKKRSVISVKLEQTDNRKTATSSAPSIFHGIDAGILTLIVNQFQDDLALIHDSAGTHPNDIARLKNAANDSLLELSKGNKLKEIVEQILQEVPEKYKEKLLATLPMQGTWDTIQQDLENNRYSWN